MESQRPNACTWETQVLPMTQERLGASDSAKLREPIMAGQATQDAINRSKRSDPQIQTHSRGVTQILGEHG